MATDRMQTQRFELKYLVGEEKAWAVRDFISFHLEPDEFAARCVDYTYPVHSLYLDSGDLETYQAVQDGHKNRFKLRLRYYGDDDRTIFFEIKRRTNEVITKARAGVRREAVAGLLQGELPQFHHLTNPTAAELAALQEFCRLMRMLGATPRSHVAYRREAWMSMRNNSMRVTFDRQVQCEPKFGPELTTGIGRSVAPFQKNVILELKFADRMPNWCGDMVRSLNLVRGGAPKYALGVWTMGEHAFTKGGVDQFVPLRLPKPAIITPPAIALPDPVFGGVPAAA
jgi:hypothetical protein